MPVRISRLEQRPDGTVTMQVDWLVVSRKDPRAAVPESATLTKAATSARPEDVVAAQSELIRELSEKIAASLRAALTE